MQLTLESIYNPPPVKSALLLETTILSKLHATTITLDMNIPPPKELAGLPVTCTKSALHGEVFRYIPPPEPRHVFAVTTELIIVQVELTTANPPLLDVAVFAVITMSSKLLTELSITNIPPPLLSGKTTLPSLTVNPDIDTVLPVVMWNIR